MNHSTHANLILYSFFKYSTVVESTKMMLLFSNDPYSHKNYHVMKIHFLLPFLLLVPFYVYLESQLMIAIVMKFNLMTCFRFLHLHMTYSIMSFHPPLMQANFLVVTKFIGYLL